MCVAAQTDETSIDISRGLSTTFGSVWSAAVSAWLQAEAKSLLIKSYFDARFTIFRICDAEHVERRGFIFWP